MRKIFSAAVGFAIAALFTWLLVQGLNWREVGATLSAARGSLLFAALFLLIADYGLRVFRWQSLLAFTGNRVAYARVMSPLLTGFAANNILPFRIGDVLRVVMLGRTTDTPLTDGVGTLLIERVWDLAALSLLFALSLQGASSQVISHFAPAASGLACLIVTTFISVAFLAKPLAERLTDVRVRHSGVESGLRLIGKLCAALAKVSRPAHVIRVGLLSFMTWGVEGAVLYLCGLALHMDLSFHATYFVLAAANLSGLLPGTPGNVGTFHYFAVLAATSFGVNTNQAAALAISFHALMWVPITLSGLICFATSPIGLRKIVFNGLQFSGK